MNPPALLEQTELSTDFESENYRASPTQIDPTKRRGYEQPSVAKFINQKDSLGMRHLLTLVQQKRVGFERKNLSQSPCKMTSVVSK